MSIVGQPHERHTVKSSWEILDSPVPFRQPHRHHSPYHSPTHSSADQVPDSTDKERFVKSQRVTPINSESDNSSQHSDANLKFAEQDIHGEPITDSPGTSDLTGVVSAREPDSADRESDVNELIANTSAEDHRPAVNPVNRDVHREPQSFSSGAATYVSTQPRQADDIADTIAAEFEQHARRSQSSHRREYLENRAQLLHGEIIPEFSEIDQHSRHSEASQHLASQRTTLQRREDSVESTEVNEQLDQQSRDNTDIDRISHTSNAVREHRVSSQFQIARNYSEVGVMSVSSAVSSRSELPSIVSNHGNEIEPILLQHNDRRHLNSGRVDSATNQSRQRRRESNQRNGEQASVRQRSAHTDSNNTINNEISPNNQTNQREISQSDYNQPSTSSGVPSFEVTSRSVPDGGDISPVRFGVEQDPSPSGPNIASPIFHPPPTIVQNGISQSDLLQLMSKGLGNFTTEMAVLVIEKLKPEYEAIAKKVGNEVKEATVSELKELREKLRETEYKLESMSDERDFLKTENIKERDLIKREFEKDRLKRVKEFEEKNEFINKLRAESEKLQNTLKDKDKYLKKAESKVKSEEAKRLKSEEESEKRLKDLQKELDKAKGEILVLKSRKRIQLSSAAKNRKEALLGKLNSNHRMYPRHFNGHLPYDEGDDG